MAKLLEKRRDCRYEATEDRAAVGWWQREQFHNLAAVLIDVSMGGASALVDAIPPADGPIWLRLERPSPTEWVEAAVVRVEQTRRGPHVVRMRFADHCPYEFFRAAVFGDGLQGRAVEYVATEFETRAWR